jgi:hypothetical protein
VLEAAETEEVNAVLSSRLRELFDVPLISLSATMLLCVLGSLVLSVAILIAQVRNKSARILRRRVNRRTRRGTMCHLLCL